MSIDIGFGISRDAEGIKCPCGGYAERVEVTPEEDAAHGCWRLRCCSRAFVCVLCKKRLVGKASAPEMD